MCTAISFKTQNNYYFGRTLDVCASHGERVVISPRGYEFKFKHASPSVENYAIMGIAHVAENFPLYYEAMNEKGLCMAGLNFPQNAVYHAVQAGKQNVAPYELIPFILGRCADLAEAESLLTEINVADISFSEKLPHTPLHWIIGDKTGELTVESVKSGLKVYENPVGVLTNNPPFEAQLLNLKNHAWLSPFDPENNFCKKLNLSPYSRGMGALGLPGDWSSPSRFVRAAFVKFNHCETQTPLPAFFRIMNTVAVPKGCVMTEDGCQYTVYTCCFDTENSAYHYSTYDKHEISSVKMFSADLDGKKLICYEL